MALKAAKREAQHSMNKINESLRLLDDVDVDLALHSSDDVESALLKVKLATVLPHNTPGLLQVEKASKRAVEALVREATRV